MGNIVLLDDLTINKIAAGEVIERPASAIKEMVENSIDAGATNITVEIKNGGISYIRITDNGKGIAEDDLEIAFERHATSKIRSAEDLSTVKSMGFRGEALASIAAISRVELVSKTATQANGQKIVVEGGNIIEKSETGACVGTTITVTNLFYNTPVRYKFLRKDFTEAGYIEDAISRIALAHPEIALKLINTGRTVIQTNGNGDIKTVIYSLYGKTVANSIIDVDYELEDIHIYGVIGKPEIARSNRANQIFFVNKRYVKDKVLSSATERAYKDYIPSGKFAFAVLNIDMNPRKVDVNVHPAKLEVRFENENTIFKAVYNSIKEKHTLLAGCDEVKNFIPCRHHAKCPLLCCDKRSCRICKSKQLCKIFVSEIFKTVFQHIIQGACTEGVSCASSFNSIFLKERSSLNFSSAVISAASILTKCDQHKGDMIFFFNKGSTLVIIGSIKKKFYFIIRNLQYIAALHTVFDFFTGIVQIFPEWRA